MQFNTLVFFSFFIVFLAVFHFAIKKQSLKVSFLLFSSLVFYSYWDIRFAPLIIATSAFDFWMARLIENTPDKKSKKAYLVLSIILNIGVLALFKYAQFFTHTTYQVAHYFNLTQTPPPVLHIILPIGISFYTLQSLSYVIDVYRGDLHSKRSLVEFLSAVSFFPHLMAGPLVRASTLLPQFRDQINKPGAIEIRNGLLIFALGFLKKGIGDIIALTTDSLYGSGQSLNFYQSWLASVTFLAQVYADFSGYADMAIGTSLLIGIKLPESFNLPYFSVSPQDFLRRWNITLSEWFRDYLYIPLGGKAHKPARNILICMFVSGLWHGAGWNFILWGMFFGVWIIAYYIIQNMMMRVPSIVRLTQKSASQIKLTKIIINLYILCCTMVMFRSTDMNFLLNTIKSMHRFSEMLSTQNIFEMTYILILLGVIAALHGLDYYRKMIASNLKDSVIFTSWAVIGVLFALSLALTGKTNAFIYFHF